MKVYVIHDEEGYDCYSTPHGVVSSEELAQRYVNAPGALNTDYAELELDGPLDWKPLSEEEWADRQAKERLEEIKAEKQAELRKAYEQAVKDAFTEYLPGWDALHVQFDRIESWMKKNQPDRLREIMREHGVSLTFDEQWDALARSIFRARPIPELEPSE